MALIPFPEIDGEDIKIESFIAYPEIFGTPTETPLGLVKQRRIGNVFAGRFRGTFFFTRTGIDKRSQERLTTVATFLEDMRDLVGSPPVCEMPINTLMNRYNVQDFPTPSVIAAGVTVASQAKNTDGELVTTLSGAAPTLRKRHYLNVDVNGQTMLVRIKEVESTTKIILRPAHAIAAGTSIEKATKMRIRSDFLAEPPDISFSNDTGHQSVGFQYVEVTYE